MGLQSYLRDKLEEIISNLSINSLSNQINMVFYHGPLCTAKGHGQYVSFVGMDERILLVHILIKLYTSSSEAG